MAGTLNKVMLIGNLGKDPETRHFEGGGMLVRFPIATSESYTNRAGEQVTNTEWHNIVVGRRGLAEVCEKYLKKGHKVYLEGRIKTRQWQDESGQNRYSTEINVDNMTMLTSRQEADAMSQNTGGSTPASAPYQAPEPAAPKPSAPSFDSSNEEDDLPF
ncbi:MAG: single-stranded DNA-binding protein [Schleiferiaceae bacterium]